MPPKKESEVDTRIRSISSSHLDMDEDRRCTRCWAGCAFVTICINLAVCVPLYFTGDDARKLKVFYVALGISVVTLFLYIAGVRTGQKQVDNSPSSKV